VTSRRICPALRRRPTRRAGFTLVELLVAAGITAFLAASIAAIVANISTTAARAGNRLGTDAQARIVLDQIQLDLQSALFREDGNVWLAADVLTTTGTSGLWQVAPRNPKPTGGLSQQLTAANLAQARFNTAGVWLRFFTNSKPVTNAAGNLVTPSAPVAVGYQIVRRFTATNPANLGTAYLLHRSEARPATANGRIGTFEAGFSITTANYTTSTSGTNNGSVTGDPRSIRVPGNARNLDSVIADNVIDFGIRAYVRDPAVPGGLRLIFPANAAGSLSNNPQALSARLRSDTPTTDPAYNFRFLMPDVIDVMVRILTDRGAADIANIEKIVTPALPVPQKYNNNAAAWWWGIAEEHSRVYTRRIVLNAKPL
jgi:type II secretory pathway pseudopilin PulG